MATPSRARSAAAPRTAPSSRWWRRSATGPPPAARAAAEPRRAAQPLRPGRGAERGHGSRDQLSAALARQVEHALGEGVQHPPGDLGIARGLRIVGIGVEQHVGGAERPRASRSARTWSRLPSPATRSPSGSAPSVSRSRMRGHRAGSGPAVFAISRSRGRPESRSQSTRIRIGCQASPCRTARRSAASLAPPTQIGGCGRCSGCGAVRTFRNDTKRPS